MDKEIENLLNMDVQPIDKHGNLINEHGKVLLAFNERLKYTRRLNMSELVQGVVEEVINNGKAKGSGIRIVGHGKFGVFDPAEQKLEEITVGTNVAFKYNEKPSGGQFPYKNIAGKITTLADGVAMPAPPVAVPAANTNRYRKNGEAGGFPIHPKAYERALDRRNALNAAVELAKMIPTYDEEVVLKMAKKFEAYTTGDLDADAENAMLMDNDQFE